MGLYFVAFDKQPLTPDQIQEIQKDLPLEIEPANEAPKAASAPKKNVYDSRFDDQVQIEDPNPVLGTKWDSPLDAIPGRLTPEENEKLRTDAKAQKVLDQAASTEKIKQAQKDKPKDDKLEENRFKEGKLKEANLKEEKLKDDKSKETPKADRPQEGKSKATPKEGNLKGRSKAQGYQAKKDASKNNKVKEGQKTAKPKSPMPSKATSKNEKPKDRAKDDKPKNDKSKPGQPKKAPIENGSENNITEEEAKEVQHEEDTPKAQKNEKSKPENSEGEPKETKEKVPAKKPDSKAQTEKVSDPQKEENEQNVDTDEKTALDKPVPPEDYVAFCVAVKDQAPDLPEFFIHHYHHIGIRRFYIMDDRSEKPLSTTLEDYGIPDQWITFESQTPYNRAGGQSEQLSIYTRCLQTHRAKHTWMAFIDVDEFIEMTAGNETLQDLLHELEKHEDIGALAMNWRMHTSSGLKTRPESARKAFVDCTWDDEEHNGQTSHNRHVKSIVRMSKAESPIGPHLWNLVKDAKTVGEHMDPVTSEAWRWPITRNRIALHHYAGKSREEYEEKMLRGNAMDDPKTEAFWNSLEHDQPQVPCPEMAKYDP